MKLSNRLLDLLKNFSQINNSIVLPNNRVLRTINKSGTVFAMARIEEDFDREAGVVNLGTFLTATGFGETPNLELSDSGQMSLEFPDGNRITMSYADPSMVTAPPERFTFPNANGEGGYSFPEPEIRFDLSKDDLSKIHRATSLGANDFVVRGKGGKAQWEATNLLQPDSNTFYRVFGDSSVDYEMIFRIKSLTLVPQDYTVEIVASKKISRFTSADGNLVYLITLDPNSSYGE